MSNTNKLLKILEDCATQLEKAHAVCYKSTRAYISHKDDAVERLAYDCRDLAADVRVLLREESK